MKEKRTRKMPDEVKINREKLKAAILKKMPIAKASRAIGRSDSFLGNIVNGGAPIRRSDLERVCELIGIYPEKVIWQEPVEEPQEEPVKGEVTFERLVAEGLYVGIDTLQKMFDMQSQILKAIEDNTAAVMALVKAFTE